MMPRIIAIDPGPIPGLVMLTPHGPHLDVDIVQCSASIAPIVLYALLDQHRASLGTAPVIVQIEKFVVGRASQRSAGAGTITRDLVGKLQREAETHEGVSVVMRSASEVKPWATDVRLEKAGLLAATKGMPHARDAARHALFCAVKGGYLPDPLSSDWKIR